MQIRVLVNEKLLPNKIGTNFGSVSNWISSKTWFKYDALTIGNGATVYSWSDRYGATLVDIIKRNGKQFIVVQEDHAERTDNNGMSESQSYKYSANPEGKKHYAQILDIETEDGQKGFILEPRYLNPQTNRFNKDGHRITLGHRSKFHDYSF